MPTPTGVGPAVADAVAGDRGAFAAHGMGVGWRLAILGLNVIPALHVAAISLLLVLPWSTPLWRGLAALAALYLAPAALARLILVVAPFRSTTIRIDSPELLRWWALFNLQALFCRFPALEEALRVVPNLYSLWLRLWGAKIGSLVYWAPGTLILDRSFLDIGADVMLGAGVRLNPHVLSRNERGELELLLAPVRIGRGAVVGGYSLLTSGTEILPGEVTPAFLISPPFSRWQGGKRVRDRAAAPARPPT
jgi:hypothetical protein